MYYSKFTGAFNEVLKNVRIEFMKVIEVDNGMMIVENENGLFIVSNRLRISYK